MSNTILPSHARPGASADTATTGLPADAGRAPLPATSRPPLGRRQALMTGLGGMVALGAGLGFSPAARAQTPASGGGHAPASQAGTAHAQNPHAARQAQLLEPNPAEFKRQYDTFVDGKPTRAEGLKLDVPVLADNPSAVPVRVIVTLPVTDEDWCEELILLAERNPIPLACRIFFTPLAGVAETAVRVRLSQSQTIHALARMKNGQILAAKQEVTVAASGCGM